MADDLDDDEFRLHLINSDIRQLCSDVSRYRIDQELLKNDDDAAVTITAGAGGVDSCDWAMMLYKMYKRWSASKAMKFTEISTTEGGTAGYVSATFKISGKCAYGWLQGESGIHRLVRISPFDSKTIPESEIRVDTFKSSGPGGQHANKTESAVRITHIPTGVVVECKSERSQIQNRATCMDLLQARLRGLERDKERQQRSDERKRLPDNSWGSQVRSYVLNPYQMVKDARSGYSSTQAEAVLAGDIDDFLISNIEHRIL
ncbi:hypothetical protein LPJ53_004321 [Coemansia erecta]|uniref:Peptide chain release factor domain-containing protein n=1 Tax=Coemansia erecta TaxID=147472 RepID=A0A9W8CR22_9FUNG|nr:hypothetical protein LPJ53_004321 [Coemansia erecta]